MTGILLGVALIHGSIAAAQGEAEIYEQERMARVLGELGLQPDSAPEGKTIAFIRIVRHDVFVKEEPWPTWLNTFHWLTRQEVIERELLFKKGDPYRESAVQETMRNLRDLDIFSLVSIKAVKADRPDRVGVVVHTRDLWSLRLEQDFLFTGSKYDFLLPAPALGVAFMAAANFTGSKFDYLFLKLTERNLFGRDKRASLRFKLYPVTFSLGQAFTDRRVFGQKLALSESVDLIFNRDSGQVEGSLGALQFGRPFYDLGQRWSFLVSAAYSDAISRRIRNGKVVKIDLEETPEYEGDDIPVVFDDRSIGLRATGSYRRGRAYKQTFSAGAGYRDQSVAPNSETALLPGQEDAFRRAVLPRVRREVFPFIGYQLYLPRYSVFENLGTFGQSENVRTGPAAEMLVEVPVRAFGSSSDSVLVGGGLGYTWARFDALIDLAIEPSARLEDGRVVDQLLAAELRGATPPVLAGRVVLRATWQGRRRDTSNVAVSLGGDNGLRGYPSQYFPREGPLEGASLVRSNLEYRTLPLQWRSIHLGAVLFYDAGTVYRDILKLDLHHAAGLGLRLLFPQFNRYVFRFDLGTPLDQKGFEVLFSFGSGQAVELTAAEMGASI